MARMTMLLSIGVLGFTGLGCSGHLDAPITQAELVKRTQEILDAATAGNAQPFERYFAEDSLDHDEKGRSMDKKALLADITPPPPDWSGSLVLKDPRSIITSDAAVLTYDLAETETISGQTMHARYHTTDTWLRRDGVWKIAAEQALRYYEDPAVGTVEPARFPEYLGVYELVVGKTLEVSSVGSTLYSQRSGKDKVQLLPESGDVYFRKGVEGRYLFRRNAQGKVDALIDRRNNEDTVWRKIHYDQGPKWPTRTADGGPRVYVIDYRAKRTSDLHQAASASTGSVERPRALRRLVRSPWPEGVHGRVAAATDADSDD